MDNLNTESNPSNLELLRLARDLAYSDYNNRKADIHNKWITDSAQLWKSHRQRLAYPPIPPYPTEEEIIGRAVKLIDFLSTPRPDLDQPDHTVDAVADIAYIEAPTAEIASEKVLASMMQKFENLFTKGEKK